MKEQEVLTRESVTEFVKIFIGGAIMPIRISAEKVIDHYVDMAFKYDIRDKKAYCLEEVRRHISNEDGIIRSLRPVE